MSESLKGNVRQAVSRWCYRDVPFEQLCAEAAAMGIQGIDLLAPGQDWEVLKKHGLACSMVTGGGNNPGLNRKEGHAEYIARTRASIEAAAEAGFPNVICMSGNRAEDLTDDEGQDNCVEGLKQIVGFAEASGVTLCLELLNSKRDHKGYMCDRTAWGVEVCKRVGSESLKLLYDIYHMQIDEGDVIATIRENAECIGHYHTGGVPGRHEIDDTQELNYPAIMRAIVETGFTGFVAHEFIPQRDPMTSLREAVAICDV